MNNFLQLGQVAIKSRNTAEAIQWFEKAVQEAPLDAQALACLGQALCWANQQNQGLNYLQKAGKQLVKKARKNKDTRQLLLMAEQLQFWNDYPNSLELVKQAVQINKKDARGFQILAHTYSRLNKNELALTASRQALKKAPDNTILNIQQATLEARIGLYDAAIKRLQSVLEKPSSNEEQFRAHKELAIIFDKIGQYHQVFPHLHQSAELSALLPDVKKQDKTSVPNMLKAYTSGFEKKLLNCWGKTQFQHLQQPAPVFLIGFLRSGTTLTQEVLDTHPEVFISDETDLVVAMRNELDKISHGKGSTAEQLTNANLSIIEHLRNFYWERAKNRYGQQMSGKLFIDKTTMNIFDIGLINCVFPEAKIIFVARDPRDVCLSCFMQIMQPTPTTIHLLNWENTIDLYCKTMAWWLYVRELMSLDTIEFRYEDSITDFEATFRKLFSFVDLQWVDSATDFHKHAAKKFIASPSFSQVSQPLYSSSVARWKRYETEFEPVISKLQPFIDAFHYN